MEDAGSVRLDKWLWAVRLYKTRSLAAEACRGGHVTIGSATVKPSREVRVGETITTTHEALTRTTRVLGLTVRRVGAPAAKQLAEDLTPPEEYAKRSERNLQPVPVRPKGAGRPTKKERRVMERVDL